MFWITENHFLFVGLLEWGNTETQIFLACRNRDGFALAESRTRKSGTVAPLLTSTDILFFVGLGRVLKNGTEYSPADNRPEFE